MRADATPEPGTPASAAARGRATVMIGFGCPRGFRPRRTIGMMRGSFPPGARQEAEGIERAGAKMAQSDSDRCCDGGGSASLLPFTHSDDDLPRGTGPPGAEV
ncbi:hypothetical protein Acsp03_32630 [Actinomadura sp. NBRC 104412]|nr:hypothetical protein Acsp03_32630 [Actinomadura sp. NBRC 104412]